MAIITVSEKCTGCGACVKVCPQMILALDENKKMRMLDQSRCMSCYGCEDVCKFQAVLNKKAPFPGMAASEIETERHKTIRSEYDVVIVGAGPAGLGAAISCAGEGLKTAIFERLPNRQVSHHNDGGVLFSIPAVTSMRRMEGLIEFPEYDFKLRDDFIDSRMSWLGFLGPKGYRFGDRFTKDMKGYICSKDKFVHELADEAQNAGAEFFYGTRVIDVIRGQDKVVGIKLADGTEVRSKVVVAADGIMGRFSEKAGIPVNEHAEEYLYYLTLYYERPEGLTSGFAYLFGELNLDDDFPPTVGCVGVAEYVEISLIMYSEEKFYPAKKPLDHYIKKMLASDKRLGVYLKGHADFVKPVNLRGTRLRVRSEICKEIATDGAVAIGDTWVSGAQLGNINAMAHGLYTGKQLKKAFDRQDFSKASLGQVADFINKGTETTIKQMSKMILYPVLMDDKTIAKYCEIFQSMNYPTFFYGSKSQIGKMVISCLFKNFFKLMRNPGIFKYL